MHSVNLVRFAWVRYSQGGCGYLHVLGVDSAAASVLESEGMKIAWKSRSVNKQHMLALSTCGRVESIFSICQTIIRQCNKNELLVPTPSK